MVKLKSISYSKNRNRTVLKYSVLRDVEIVQEGNRVKMSWEAARNTLPKRLAEKNCQSIGSEDGKSVLISCSELKESELNIGVSKRSFTKSQHDLLAVSFIRYPNPPFKNMSLKISQRSKLFKNESVNKIQKWFEYNYRTFKTGKHPGWAIDPDTKKIRYQSRIGQDGRMTMCKRYSGNDLRIRGHYNKSTPSEVINKEIDPNPNRKINRDSNQEYIECPGEKPSTDSSAITINPVIIIKQEPVDYEAQKPLQFPQNYKIPKLSNVASYQLGDERERNSKNKSTGGSNSQLLPTYKQPYYKRKSRTRPKPKLKFTDGHVSKAKLAELRSIMQRRPEIEAQQRKRG